MKSELPQNIEVVTLNKRDGIDLRVYKALYMLLKEKRVTIFHTYNFCTIEYHMVAKACGILRRIHADHGLGGDDSQGTNHKRLLLRRAMSQLIHKYVVVSDELKKWVISDVGVKEDKVDFVFNGVKLLPKKMVNAARKDELVLTIIGRLAPVKNHERLFQSLAELRKLQPGFSLICNVVGEGPDANKLEGIVHELQLEDVVIFHGLKMDVAPFLDAADVFILSSDYEAMPMTVLEAMSNSTPVICPKVGGVTDFISANEAILAEPHSTESLVECLLRFNSMNTSERQYLVDNGHDLVSRNYSIEKMVERYFTLYGITS
nr:glycosyltransferase [Alteromonas mediterranea]